MKRRRLLITEALSGWPPGYARHVRRTGGGGGKVSPGGPLSFRGNSHPSGISGLRPSVNFQLIHFPRKPRDYFLPRITATLCIPNTISIIRWMAALSSAFLHQFDRRSCRFFIVSIYNLPMWFPIVLFSAKLSLSILINFFFTFFG